MHHMQTIREQFPDSKYNLSIQSVKFSSDASIDDPAIGINFRKRLGNWIFSLQGGDNKTVCGYMCLSLSYLKTTL